MVKRPHKFVLESKLDVDVFRECFTVTQTLRIFTYV